MRARERIFRLQVHVSDDDERAIEDFRFSERLPTRAAAVRELLRRGLERMEKEQADEAAN
jgi:hypothetical protein